MERHRCICFHEVPSALVIKTVFNIVLASLYMNVLNKQLIKQKFKGFKKIVQKLYKIYAEIYFSSDNRQQIDV